MPASYFLGPQLLGTGGASWWSDSQPSITSQAFFCPTCGEIWGRIYEMGLPWQPVIRGCSKHPHLSDVGGSFIAPWRKGCPSELPPGVLLYETQLRLTTKE